MTAEENTQEAMSLDKDNLDAILEAVLFACAEPAEVQKVAQALGITDLEIGVALEKLQRFYQENKRGLVLRFIDGKAQICTNTAYSGYIEKVLQPEQRKSFSQSVIETLSIIAYKQPITRTEIEAIRGVRCEYSITQLTAQNFIEEVGRKQTIGRPIQFGTTQKFLEHFNLASLLELPRRSEFLGDAQSAEGGFDPIDV